MFVRSPVDTIHIILSLLFETIIKSSPKTHDLTFVNPKMCSRKWGSIKNVLNFDVISKSQKHFNTYKFAHNAKLTILPSSADVFSRAFRLQVLFSFFYPHIWTNRWGKTAAGCLLFLVPCEDLKSASINLFLLTMDYTTHILLDVTCDNLLM